MNLPNYAKSKKIIIFTEGTIIMHKSAIGHTRSEIVKQVKSKEKSVHDFKSYVPIGNAVKKMQKWKADGAEIVYVTSRRKRSEILAIQNVLDRHGFPKGKLLFRRGNEKYKDIAEQVIPDILVEDDCESIGGRDNMIITHVRPAVKKKIKSIPVKEFGGIDQLSDRRG